LLLEFELCTATNQTPCLERGWNIVCRHWVLTMAKTTSKRVNRSILDVDNRRVVAHPTDCKVVASSPSSSVPCSPPFNPSHNCAFFHFSHIIAPLAYSVRKAHEVNRHGFRTQCRLGISSFFSIVEDSTNIQKDPKLLYAINGINAYHIENGREECLTPAGPQTLSLLMVPTSSPFSDLSPSEPQSAAPEEDFYLHLHLPPELDLPLPATTQIYHQPPDSYLIPRWDMGHENGVFTRIEFPGIGLGKGSQEDVDTFETILAQCTAFLERAPPPRAARPKSRRTKSLMELPIPPYDPSTFKPGEAYVPGSSSSHAGGQIVLIDEENGSVVGELGEAFHVVEDSKMQAGSKGRFIPRFCPPITKIPRSCRDHSPRRRLPQYRRRARLPSLPRNGHAPSLPQQHPRLQSRHGFPPHRHHLLLRLQNATILRRQLHPEDQTHFQTRNFHAHNARTYQKGAYFL